MAEAKATHEGILKIKDVEINCYVLEDQRRVLSGRQFTKALGLSGRGQGMARFTDSKSLKPFISNELIAAIGKPIVFRAAKGGRSTFGYEAKVLPEICDTVIEASERGKLSAQQENMVKQAKVLMRAFARVGIVALVDEATGYQEIRDKNELHRILEAYISKEYLPWTKRFPDSFYEEMFRLRGWQYRPVSVKKPKLVGKLTADLVYSQLPKGVLAELRKKNPTNVSGNRVKRHHQFLTPEIGNPHLEKQLISVVTLMRASPDWKTFEKLFKRAFSQAVQEELFDDESAASKGKKPV